MKAVLLVVAMAGTARGDSFEFCGKSFDATTKEIECGDHAVTEISVLAHAAGLEKLYLRMTKVSDLKPLAKLANLRELNLMYTPVVKLEPLAGLALSDLRLAGTKVTDLSPLAGMTTLEQLDVSDTAVRRVAALAKLDHLDQVDLRSTKVPMADAKALAKHARHVYWGENGEGHWGTATGH